ncbi:SDR family oxidoreductase [bacterium]|nr:SDR family oxidoreductase [bacterium]
MLEGRRIVLIGGTGDLGTACAEAFLSKGSNVIATGNRHLERLQALKETFREKLVILSCDVRDPASVSLAAQSSLNMGMIDSVVFNAGITRDNLVLSMEDDEWNSVLAVNLTGAFNVARAFGKILFRQRRGKFLFVSSVSARKGGRGQANYAASKAGLEAFTRAFALEMASRGVLVNVVSPGPLEGTMSGQVMEIAGDEVKRRLALGRLGKPSEVAQFISHMLDPEFSWATGSIFPIDGGFAI